MILAQVLQFSHQFLLLIKHILNIPKYNQYLFSINSNYWGEKANRLKILLIQIRLNLFLLHQSKITFLIFVQH